MTLECVCVSVCVWGGGGGGQTLSFKAGRGRKTLSSPMRKKAKMKVAELFPLEEYCFTLMVGLFLFQPLAL